MRQSVSRHCDLNDEGAQLCHFIICPSNLHLTECLSAVNTIQYKTLLFRFTKPHDSLVYFLHLGRLHLFFVLYILTLLCCFFCLL